MTPVPGIAHSAAPSGTGCAECEASGGWWLHLRRCTLCGHIGCCDTSPSQHATAHFKETGHPVIRSFEPGETWFCPYPSEAFSEPARALAGPECHPQEQTVPGPAGRVPADWR